MDAEIRVAKIEDVATIVELVNGAYRPHGESKGWTHESELVDGSRVSFSQVMELLVPNSFIFLQQQGEKVEACVHLAVNDGCAHIGMLATHPDLQGSGYGKKMLSHAENYASKYFNIKKYELVVISERKELVSFYLRRGYQQTGIVNRYPVSAGLGVPKVQELTIEVLRKRLRLPISPD